MFCCKECDYDDSFEKEGGNKDNKHASFKTRKRVHVNCGVKVRLNYNHMGNLQKNLNN